VCQNVEVATSQSTVESPNTVVDKTLCQILDLEYQKRCRNPCVHKNEIQICDIKKYDESPNTVVDKTLCQISRSRVSKKMSKPICAQECDLYFWMSKSTNDLMCTVYNNFALHLRTMTSKSVTLTLVHLKVCRKS